MIYEQLFAKSDHVVQAALIGCGDFGATIVAQGSTAPRLCLRLLADLDVEKARRAYRLAGVADAQIAVCGSAAEAKRRYEAGMHVVVQDGMIAMELPVEVVVSCTRSPEWGARFARAAIAAGKHVVMVDKEADSVVGPILKRMADGAGVVYTTDDGDEPGLLMGMAGWARSLGLEVLAGGNAHEALYDPDAGTLSSRGVTVTLTERQRPAMERIRPGNLRETIAARRGITEAFREKEECGDPYCHMAVAANGAGLLPDGEHPPHPLVYWDELPSVLAPLEMGGICRVRGAVDIPTIIRRAGDPPYGGSVYMVVHCENEHAMAKMAEKGLMVGCGGSAGVLYRPYHLCGAETAMSILCAGILGIPTGSGAPYPHVDIACALRRGYRAGDAFGPALNSGWNSDLRASLIPAVRCEGANPVPFYMLEGNRLSRDAAAGCAVTFDMVRRPADSMLWDLRQKQDRLFLK